VNNKSNSTLKTFLHYAAMLMVPLLLFCLPLVLKSYLGPYFLGYNMDPEYAYLLNSLNIINRIPPGHIDHPGTTVDLLGAVGLIMKWLSLDVNELVLRHPEESLQAINILINILIFIAIIFTSLSLYKPMKDIGSVIVFQLSLLVPLEIKLSLIRVDPEPLLVFSVIVLSGLLVQYQKQVPETIYWFKMPILVGMIMGFGLATKVTFLPLLLFIVLFPTVKERLLAVCGCVASFLLFTLPIVSQYPRMLSWFKSLMLHKGKDGAGDVGVPPITDLGGNLLDLIQQEPFLFIFMVGYLIYIVLGKSLGKQIVTDNKLLALGTGVIIIQYLMTAKYTQAYYMLPAITLIALLNVNLVASLKQYLSISNSRIGVMLPYALIIVGIIYGISSTKSWAIESRRNLQDEIKLSNVTTAMKGCTVINSYKGSSMESALAFGNEFANRRYRKELSIIYPNVHFFDIWTGTYYNYTRTLDASMVSDLFMNNRCLLMVGRPLDDKNKKNLILTPLVETTHSALYKLEGFKF